MGHIKLNLSLVQHPRQIECHKTLCLRLILGLERICHSIINDRNRIGVQIRSGHEGELKDLALLAPFVNTIEVQHMLAVGAPQGQQGLPVRTFRQQSSLQLVINGIIDIILVAVRVTVRNREVNQQGIFILIVLLQLIPLHMGDRRLIRNSDIDSTNDILSFIREHHCHSQHILTIHCLNRHLAAVFVHLIHELDQLFFHIDQRIIHPVNCHSSSADRNIKQVADMVCHSRRMHIRHLREPNHKIITIHRTGAKLVRCNKCYGITALRHITALIHILGSVLIIIRRNLKFVPFRVRTGHTYGHIRPKLTINGRHVAVIHIDCDFRRHRRVIGNMERIGVNNGLRPGRVIRVLQRSRRFDDKRTCCRGNRHLTAGIRKSSRSLVPSRTDTHNFTIRPSDFPLHTGRRQRTIVRFDLKLVALMHIGLSTNPIDRQIGLLKHHIKIRRIIAAGSQPRIFCIAFDCIMPSRIITALLNNAGQNRTSRITIIIRRNHFNRYPCCPFTINILPVVIINRDIKLRRIRSDVIHRKRVRHNRAPRAPLVHGIQIQRMLASGVIPVFQHIIFAAVILNPHDGIIRIGVILVSNRKINLDLCIIRKRILKVIINDHMEHIRFIRVRIGHSDNQSVHIKRSTILFRTDRMKRIHAGSVRNGHGAAILRHIALVKHDLGVIAVSSQSPCCKHVLQNFFIDLDFKRFADMYRQIFCGNERNFILLTNRDCLRHDFTAGTPIILGIHLKRVLARVTITAADSHDRMSFIIVCHQKMKRNSVPIRVHIRNRRMQSNSRCLFITRRCIRIIRRQYSLGNHRGLISHLHGHIIGPHLNTGTGCSDSRKHIGSIRLIEYHCTAVNAQPTKTDIIRLTIFQNRI